MSKFAKSFRRTIWAFVGSAGATTQQERMEELEAIIDAKIANKVSELRRELIPELN